MTFRPTLCWLTQIANPINSHINAETPGSIHEGGELGYALAVSFGAVMDNPDLIVTCVVGDGEAESGPTATYDARFPSHHRLLTGPGHGTQLSFSTPASPAQ